MISKGMRRVNRNRPCPICGKPDWCLISEDSSAVICPRIEQDSVKRCGDAGWLHILREETYSKHKSMDYRTRTIARISATTPKNFSNLSEKYQNRLTLEMLDQLSTSLGVSQESLNRLGVGWDGQAYTFPMSNAEGNIIGIRRRFTDGHKVSVTSSKTGLFIPADLNMDNPLLICEGGSDAAAALDLGFNSIGRPNYCSKIEMTVRAVKMWDEIIVVGDADKNGIEGAEKIGKILAVHCQSVKVIFPPQGTKDLRDWLCSGLTKCLLQDIASRTKQIEINIRFVE